MLLSRKMRILTSLNGLPLIVSFILSSIACEKKFSTSNYRSPQESLLLISSAKDDLSAGTKIGIPPEFADLSGKLQIEEGATIAGAATAAALNIDGENSLNQAGPSINISATAEVDYSQIGRLEISIPISEPSSLALTDSFLAIIYQVKDASGNIVIGLIPASGFTLASSLATFKMLGFGNYQAVRLKMEIKEEIKVKTEETKVLTKSQQQELPEMLVAAISPLIAYKGQKVTVTGSNFRPGIKLAYLGRSLSQIQVNSEQSLTVVIDEVPRRGRGTLYLAQDGIERSLSLAYAGSSSDFPLMTLAASEVCSGQKFYNANGELLEGTRNCSAQAPESSYPSCSSDGQTGCVTSTSFKAAAMTAVQAASIAAGSTIAGVTGTAVIESHSNCSGANQTACIATSNYKTMDVSASLGTASGLNAGNFASKIASSGNFEFWDATGARHSLSGDADLVAGNVKSGIDIFGIGGSVSASPAICSSDGQSNCVVDGSAYKAVALTGLASKVVSTQSVAGVPGTALQEAHSECTGAHQAGCVATSTYKTMNLSAAGATTDLTASSFNTVISTAAPFEFWDSSGARHEVTGDSDLVAGNIQSGTQIYGTNGTSSGSAPNCTSDGETNCTVIAPSFAAAATNGLANKVLVGQTVAGVNGNVTLPAASNVLIGSPSYGVSSTSISPSYSPDFPSMSNVRASDTVNGVAGTLADCSAGNQAGCVTIAAYKSMDLTGVGTATGLTAANFSGRIAAPANSEFWDATGARHSIAGDADLSAGNVKAGVVIHGVTGQYPSANFPLANSTATTDLTLFNTQLTVDGGFEFFDSAGARYTGSGDSDLVSSNIKNTVSIESLNLTGNYLASWTCPTGWIKVPGDSDYGTGDFCVMKYEAKNVAAVATSQAPSTPWVTITQTASITACRALGTGYDLISNPQWMTIGANVAGISANWTGGTPGSGFLFAGHNDNSPASACPGSSNDTEFYVETNCTAVSSGDTADQRRTLMLSNSSVIWDLSGNVREWVNYINIGDKPGATAAWFEYTAVTGTSTTALKDLIPTNAVKAFWSDAWNSGNKIGQYFPGTNASGGALLRGGAWSDASYSGVFSARLLEAPSYTYTGTGLRCALASPSP